MVELIFGIILFLGLMATAIVFWAYVEKEYPKDKWGDEIKSQPPKLSKPLAKFGFIPAIVGAICGIIFPLSSCFATVPTGNTGIVTVFGRVEDITLDAGFHLVAPWVTVVNMDNRVQKATVKFDGFSKNLQEVRIVYTVNYQIRKADAMNLYKNVGNEYYDIAIAPTVLESVKTVVAQYEADQLIADRKGVAEAIEENLSEALDMYDIIVVSTSIEDMDFSDAFTNAAEAKEVAKQQAEQAKTEKEIAKTKAEAEAEVAKTKAEADAEVAKTKANADAEVAKIQAQADKEVAQIGADSAEYQGQKEAAIALQRLASINGWTVVNEEVNGVLVNVLYKADGTKVSEEELKVGAEKLIQYYYVEQWDGKLPEVITGDASTTLIPIYN